MKTRAFLLFCILIGSIISLQAQERIKGQFKIDYVPFSNYVRPIDSVKTPSKTDFRRVEASFEIPLSVTMDHRNKPRLWSIVAQGAYAKMQHKLYEEELFPTTLLNAQVGVKHFRSISDSWSLLFMGTVGIYTTDVEMINKETILAQGGVFFIKHFNEKVALGVGPVLTNSFGVPMVLPGIYFNWETHGDFYVRVAFPQGVELGYKMNEIVDLKLAADLQGMTAVIKKDDKNMLLGFQQIVAGFRPEFKFNDNLTLSLTAGSSLVRSFSYNERKIKNIFKEKKEADPRFTSTFYGAVQLRWAL
ncbi:DUF6268 family outer membrane beta-barrel protein [Myroides sp. WP-1]|uniref:DUF6268 family outer membrane beta-barrel protein n=1 Tax=Myroides sp. WP-1 TaxID=2759944 RepID=UPI0015FAA8B2|nr:DUF6268 family outer membrane beta-barrel protein [Myroides sp. WP-1]MBB1137901.1 hypothetical protein [Myroides sp. WP-1]